MDNRNELKKKLLLLIKKEESLKKVSEELGINEYEVLGLINDIETDKVNISKRRRDDDIYLTFEGDIEYLDEYKYELQSDNNNEFKFIAISDTRLGAKNEQLSI